jgi:hypothetical protein
MNWGGFVSGSQKNMGQKNMGQNEFYFWKSAGDRRFAPFRYDFMVLWLVGRIQKSHNISIVAPLLEYDQSRFCYVWL